MASKVLYQFILIQISFSNSIFSSNCLEIWSQISYARSQNQPNFTQRGFQTLLVITAFKIVYILKADKISQKLSPLLYNILFNNSYKQIDFYQSRNDFRTMYSIYYNCIFLNQLILNINLVDFRQSILRKMYHLI